MYTRTFVSPNVPYVTTVSLNIAYVHCKYITFPSDITTLLAVSKQNNEKVIYIVWIMHVICYRFLIFGNNVCTFPVNAHDICLYHYGNKLMLYGYSRYCYLNDSMPITYNFDYYWRFTGTQFYCEYDNTLW